MSGCERFALDGRVEILMIGQASHPEGFQARDLQIKRERDARRGDDD